MKKKVGLCIGAGLVLILASLSSVIGFSTVTSQHNQASVQSPLFAVRTARSIGEQMSGIGEPSYLGKGAMSSLFTSNKPSFQSLVEKALRLLQSQPMVIESALRQALRDPQVQYLLAQKGINEQEVIRYFAQVKDNPDALAAQFESVADQIPLKSGGYRPLSLNSTNPFACVITYIVLLPVFLVIGLLIATITIVTCLNVNNCFENLINQLLQNLQKPNGNRYFN